MSEKSDKNRDPNWCSEFDNQSDTYRHSGDGEEIEGLYAGNPKEPHHEEIRQFFAGNPERLSISNKNEEKECDKNPSGSDLGEANRAYSPSNNEFGKDTGGSKEERTRDNQKLAGEFAHRVSVLESVFGELHDRIIGLLDNWAIDGNVRQNILNKEFCCSNLALIERFIFLSRGG